MRNKNVLDALFSRTRQNVLATLLLSAERRWSLSDLAHHLQVTPSTLQRELASLTEAGILCRERDGNRVYFQANPAFPILPELRTLFVKTAGLADKIQKALEPFWNQIELAFLFGSVLVGSVESAGLALPLRDLERVLQVPINVVHYTEDEFREKRHHNHFLQTVLSSPKVFLKGSEHELANAFDEPTAQDARHEQAGT